MKVVNIFICLASVVQAFPTADNFGQLLKRDNTSPDVFSSKLLELKQTATSLLANPVLKPIDVSGEHAFQAPNFAKGDQRGPCPGLNALANHAYLPRDGVAGFLDIIAATNTIFGMGVELSAVLSIMGVLGVGNPLSLNPGFSIGGETPESQNLLGNLLGIMGTPRGLDGSHNWIEGDASLTRDDLYLTGDAWTMNMTLFRAVYDDAAAAANGSLTISDIGAHALRRMEESIATNPYFYYGPYTGLIARNSGIIFAARLLCNHTDANPQGGLLSQDVFRSFWGVTVDDGPGGVELRNGFGQERIPENWYRYRGEYGLVQLNLDLVSWVLQYPRLGSIGGNMGKVNSFAGVDLSKDLGSGLVNWTMLLEGNNLICFVMQILKTFVPNSLSTMFKVLQIPLELLNDALLDPLLNLDCPAFEDLTAGGTDFMGMLLDRYPGAKKAGLAF